MTGSQHKRTLDRLIWRSRLKALLRIGGILLMLVGGMFIPSCYRDPGPKTTIFNRIVKSGTFAEPGMILIGTGALALAASWLIRENLYDP